MQNTANATSAAAASTVIASAKTRAHIYTKRQQKVRVSLWLGRATKERAPKFVGTIGGVQCSGFIRQSAKGPFVSFVGERQADGTDRQVATASVVVGPAGIPKMVLTLADGGGTVWAETSLDLGREHLVECGLKEELLESRRNEIAARRAAKENVAEAVA